MRVLQVNKTESEKMRINKTAIVFAMFVSFFLSGSASVSGQENLRTVKKNILKSEKSPPIRLKFNKKFKYAGSQSFILFDNSQVEQHYFVLADKKMNAKRIYTVQFESFLPGNTETYDYKIDDKLNLAGDDFMVDFIAGNIQYALDKRPDSDTARRWKYLKEKNYKLPAEVIGRRFIRLLDESKRSEILIIYQEDVQNFKTNLTELDEPNNKEKLDKIFAEVAKNSTEGFKVLEK
jgi:hypothetical protein